MRNPMVGVVGLTHGRCVNSVTCLAINSTVDTIATGSDEGLVILWHIHMSHRDGINGLKNSTIDIIPTSLSVTSKFPMTTPILDLCFVVSSLPNAHLGINENLVTLHADNSICLWSMIDLRCIARVNFTFKFYRLAVLADRRFIAAFGREIHIIDTWNLGIIGNLQTEQPILDLACTQYPQLHSIKPSWQPKQLICAVTNGELYCWDVTNSCASKQPRFSKTEYILNYELSDSKMSLDNSKTTNQMKTPLTSTSINKTIGKIKLNNQICVSTNLIFAIAGPRITVCIASNKDNELYPLMDFLNPDIDADSKHNGPSNWRYIQLIDLSRLTNLSGNDEMYSDFMDIYKTALIACNDQRKVYCYILPENTSTDDESLQFHSLVKATYVGQFADYIYSTATPVFITRGYTTNCTVRENGYETCCLDFVSILANSKGIFIQQFINSSDSFKPLDSGLELKYSMENILPKPICPSIKLSAMATIKVNNTLYIAYCFGNGSICCIGRNERVKLHSPQILLDFIINKNRITEQHRIIYNFHASSTLFGLNPLNQTTAKAVKHTLSVNDNLILTDGYSTCVYKFSGEIYPSYFISGWHSHKIRSLIPVIVPMGSLVRQSLDHFATVDVCGRIIIWHILSFSTYLTQYGELPPSHYILERVMVKNIYKFILDEPRSLAIAITLKRVLIWSLETQCLISNESKMRYSTFSSVKNTSGSISNVADTFTSLVPHIKRLVYGNNKAKDTSNYYGSGKNGLKFSVPRYHNVLFSKDLFKDEYLSTTGGGVVCSNLYLKGQNNKSICMPIIASAVTSKIDWLTSLDTFPVNFLPCTLGGFWITIHLTLSINQRKQYEDRNIIGFPDVKFSIYNVRSSYLCNLLDLSQISYKLYKFSQNSNRLYDVALMGLDIDRIWLLGHYVLIGSLPGQTIDLIIMGKRAEQLLRELFSSFGNLLSIHVMALLLGLMTSTRLYIQKLKVLSYPPSIYLIDKWTFKYILKHKVKSKLSSNLKNLETITITEEDAESLKKLPRSDSYKSSKTVSTGALHVGLTPQFPITDLACTLLSILVYENPIVASNTFAYIDNSSSTSEVGSDNSYGNRFVGEEIFTIAVRLLGCKIFSYTESFTHIPLSIPPFNGSWKADHTDLFTRLLASLFPLLPFGCRSGLASNIMNNLMLGYPHTLSGVRNDFKRIITASALHSPDVLSNSLHFAQLNSNFVSDITHHLLSNGLILPETLHLFSYYIVTTLITKKEIKKFMFKFPMVSIRDDVIAFGYANGTIHLYNTYNGQLIKEFFAHASAVACLTLDSHGENIAVYQHKDPALHVWKVINYNFFKNFTTSTNMYRKLELKRLQGDFTAGLENVKLQFKSKNEWFLHREDGRAYIVRG